MQNTEKQPNNLQSKTTLDEYKTALCWEDTRRQAEETLENIKNSYPEEPQIPVPPALKPPQFTPIPYPEIAIPDFGGSPWYGRAKVLLLLGILLIAATFFSIFTLPLDNPIRDLLTPASGVGALLIWLAIMFALKGFFGTDKRAEKYLEKVQSTSEYKQQCAYIDAENKQKLSQAQQIAQNEYQAAQHEYINQSVPKYEALLKEYKTITLPTWEASLCRCKQILQFVNEELESVYATNSIPMEFRNYDALNFIVTQVETIGCSLNDAILQYEQKNTSDQIREALNDQKRATEEIRSAVALQNESIDQLEAHLEQTQSSLNRAKRWSMAGTALAGYAAYKSHKTGKQLKDKSER